MPHDSIQSARTTLKRRPERGRYDRETVHAILDRTFLCHVGFVHDGQPFVIPTAFGREDDVVYIHGAAASRMQHALAGGVDVCLTATIVDGLVLARAAFHASINYRSVVILGRAVPVSGSDAKRHALSVISERILPGRWNDMRPPTEKELAVTSVLAIRIDEASAKIRSGPPKDDVDDMARAIWAGVLPMGMSFGEPVPDAALVPGVAVPAYLAQPRKSGVEQVVEPY